MLTGRDVTRQLAHDTRQQVLNLALTCFQCVFFFSSSSQACATYENFMIDLAKLIRTDRHLKVNDTYIRQEVARVMMMEKEIANVSMETSKILVSDLIHCI